MNVEIYEPNISEGKGNYNDCYMLGGNYFYLGHS